MLKGRLVTLHLKFGTSYPLHYIRLSHNPQTLNAVLNRTHLNSFHISLSPFSQLSDYLRPRFSRALTLCALQIFILLLLLSPNVRNFKMLCMLYSHSKRDRLDLLLFCHKICRPHYVKLVLMYALIMVSYGHKEFVQESASWTKMNKNCIGTESIPALALLYYIFSFIHQ